MQLQQIELLNFRQFRNEAIEFAQSSDKNVTVVHGANGSGKSTLLNAFTWLLYDEVDFDTRPDRLASEGAMAEASTGESICVCVELDFLHDGTEYVARREIEYEKRADSDFDGELVDANMTVEYRKDGQWEERLNPDNTLDQIIPKRLSGLFFFDGEDIDELAGIDNQDRIQEAIQNIMGLTILERSTRHLDTVADRFEDEVEKYASDELSDLISQKRDIQEAVDDLQRKLQDTKRSKDQVEQEIFDLEQKLERLDESAALQERRNEYREERSKIIENIEEINEQIRKEVSDYGFIPLSMPLIRETAEELDSMRERGLIPSELSNSFIDSLLESGSCLCGRELKPGTEHYRKVEAMKGEAIGDGVEQGALRIVGHLNRVSEEESEFFETVDEIIEERKELHDKLDDYDELIDEISSELQKLDQTTESGQTIGELESEREENERNRDTLISDIGGIEERIDHKKDELKSLKEEIEQQRDEHEEALLAKRRQKATELVEEELESSFSEFKNQVREWANDEIKKTFGEIASKNFTAEITEEFKLKIWQEVGDDRVEVDKSTGERQIASLAFIGSLVKIARQRYESENDSEYFTGGIYPLVMDSPFGALDKRHRQKVGEVIPTLANQVVVFATDSQWEGPVEEEMSDRIGEQFWLDYNPGESLGEYPQTKVRSESTSMEAN